MVCPSILLYGCHVCFLVASSFFLDLDCNMTTPPGYGDLGKAARDLFSKGFNYGKNNLEIKTKSALGVDFKATASNNHDSGQFGGNLETKLKCSDYSKYDNC